VAVSNNNTTGDILDMCPSCSRRPLSSEGEMTKAITKASSAPGYCPSYGGSHEYEYISSVTYTQNPSGTMTITVNIYIANPTGCTYGEPCPEYDDSPEYVNVWIDWNGDKDFYDSGEKVMDVALTGYLGINYHGTMTASGIVTVPPGAVNSTWMRVNLGWGYDPDDPCTEYWTWGDVVDKVVQVQAVEPPKIEEIIITPKNPMTRHDVTFEAKITDVPEFEICGIDWIITDVASGKIDFFDIGNKNPYTHKPAAGEHGKKKVLCTIFYKNKATGATGLDQESKEFKLFFEKKGDEDGDGEPNWFEYWKRDAAVPNMGSFTYDPAGGYGGFTPPTTLELGPHACDEHYPTKYTIGGITFGGAKGIDCAAEVCAHELYHKWVYDNWHDGWKGQPDPDGDELPNEYENTTSHTNISNPDTHNVAGIRHYAGYASYGDQEWMAMRAGDGKKGIDEKDWANPGSQTDGVTAALSEFTKFNALKRASWHVKQTVSQAEFVGNYSDCGNDTNGNSLYDYLTITMDVNITDTGYYVIVGWLNDTYGNEVDLVNNLFYLEAGINTVELNFDGLTIHHHGVNGPYSLSLILANEEGDEIHSQYDIYDTSPYSYTDFEGQQIWFTSNYSDYGTDADGDGIYNYLTVEVETNTTITGNYTIEGYLYGDDETAIVFASNSTYFGIGTQTVVLNFDGLPIALSKMDGPYTLSYLTLYDENGTQIDFIYDAYNTSAYNYIDFWSPTASFRDTYSDYGLDTNGDGFYEYLTIEIGINVTIAGNYSTHGRLYDSYGNETAEIYNLTCLNAGNQTVTLNFDGNSIYKHGVNGSFNLTNVLLYDENGTLMDNRYYAYTTSAYNYTDFQPLIRLTGNYSDYGTDTDGNGLFDNLTVDVGVMLANEGHCVATARLVDSNGEEIIWASNTSWLYAGEPQVIQLNFDGRYIYGNMMDGPYYIKDVYVYHTGDPTLPDYVHDAYTTAAYNYTDFEKSGIIAGTVKSNIGIPISNASVYVSGVDYDYTDTAGNYSLTILHNGTYNVTAEPPTGVNLSSNSTIVNVTVGEIAFVDFILWGAPEQFFDTGPGTYPSIFGTHNGTIKPSHDVLVQRMYTYPCAGTGGHSEYVKFWNESWNITADWKGYQGDYHNITFDEPFTLYAGLTYNYTIRTGSYPQIHHNRTLTVPDGEITCSEFIDANGKTYTDWIPAIRLE